MAKAHHIYGVLIFCTVQVVLGNTTRPPWTRSCKSTDTADEVLAGIDLSGKRIIYTGADGNIAGESLLALAKANASLIFACRTPSKCESARDKILKTIGKTREFDVEQLDLSSQTSIKDFVKRTTAKHSKIDVLINSAGTYSSFMTQDKLVGTMEINLLGPALLTHLLLPSLRGHGRVVNVAAAAYRTEFPKNMTATDLAALCTAVDPTLNQTGGYYGLSKFLMVHHALEVAKRESNVTAFALAPGVAIHLPDWLSTPIKHGIVHFPYPDWLFRRLPKHAQHFIKACTTNEAGLESCPEKLSQGAGVIVAAAAWPNIEPYSGSYLDFDTTLLTHDEPNVYGPWTQSDPTCVPREPTPMDASLRSAWYDEMLRLMGSGSRDIPVLI